MIIAAMPPQDIWVRLSEQSTAILKFYGATAGFILTLYALYAKDSELRQSRRELFYVLVLVMLAFLLQCVTWTATRLFASGHLVPGIISLLALTLFGAALTYFFFRVQVLTYLRIEKFKDRPFLKSLKHLPLIRKLVRTVALSRAKTYETTPMPRPAIEKYTILNAAENATVSLENGRGASWLITYDNAQLWLKWLAAVVREHVSNGDTITLIACRHHPAQLVNSLESVAGELLTAMRERTVIVDGFTEVFGGDDEVFPKRNQLARDNGWRLINASSVPAIHSGAARAFAVFKKSLPGQRRPATIIYDGLLVYRHCHSEDYLVRFFHHMIEAERTYSMLTIAGEPAAECESTPFSTARALVDCCCTLRVSRNGTDMDLVCS